MGWKRVRVDGAVEVELTLANRLPVKGESIVIDRVNYEVVRITFVPQYDHFNSTTVHEPVITVSRSEGVYR